MNPLAKNFSTKENETKWKNFVKWQWTSQFRTFDDLFWIWTPGGAAELLLSCEHPLSLWAHAVQTGCVNTQYLVSVISSAAAGTTAAACKYHNMCKIHTKWKSIFPKEYIRSFKNWWVPEPSPKNWRVPEPSPKNWRVPRNPWNPY